MKIRIQPQFIVLASLVLAPAAFAAEDAAPTDSDTITVVDEDAKPADVVNTLTLPAKASAKAVEKSAKGLATANAARESQGNETAAEARELGREFGERTAEEARQSNPGAEVRETAGDARNDRANNEHRPESPGKP